MLGMRVRELNLDELDLKYGQLSVRRPVAERRLLASLGEVGQQSPVIVVAVAEAGRFVVVDGHKRVRALKKLKADVAKAVVWELPEGEALATAYQMWANGRRDAFEEGWLVAQLHRGFGWSLGEVGDRLVRSKSWVSRRLGLVESLPERVQELVQNGRIGSYSAAKHLLPLARANGPGCERLAEKIGELGLTSRQVAVVCEHYGCGRGRVAARILEDPLLFLKAREAAKIGRQELGLNDGENRCVKSLEMISNVSLGLVRTLPKVLNYDTTEDARARLWDAWRRTRESLQLLTRTVRGVVKSSEMKEAEADHAEPGNEDGYIDAAQAGPWTADDRQGPGCESGRGGGRDRQRTDVCSGAAP